MSISAAASADPERIAKKVAVVSEVVDIPVTRRDHAIPAGASSALAIRIRRECQDFKHRPEIV